MENHTELLADCDTDLFLEEAFSAAWSDEEMAEQASALEWADYFTPQLMAELFAPGEGEKE